MPAATESRDFYMCFVSGQQKTLKILYAGRLNGNKGWNLKETGKAPFKECPHKNCFISTDEREYRKGRRTFIT